MDIARLRQELERALTENRTVTAVVGVVGTTEEGAVDLVHELMGLREKLAQRGLRFSLHCDPAYGGYLAACFRTAAGEFRGHDQVQREYTGWPSEEMYKSYAALKHVDSFTVDQHKLGCVPYRGRHSRVERHSPRRSPKRCASRLLR